MKPALFTSLIVSTAVLSALGYMTLTQEEAKSYSVGQMPVKWEILVTDKANEAPYDSANACELGRARIDYELTDQARKSNTRAPITECRPVRQ